MVDKLECVLELGSRFTPEAVLIRAEVKEGIQGRPTTIPFKKSKYYSAVVDLRDVTGDDALLHVQSRFGNHADKLELLDTGEKKWDALASTISHIYDGNPEDLPVRRVDLCVDIPDVSVERLARSVRVNYKRVERQFGELVVDQSKIVKSTWETYQVGNRPNPVRIYDKNAETKERYKAAKRRHENSMAWAMAKTIRESAGLDDDSKEFNRGLEKRLKPAASRTYPFPDYETWSGMWEWQTLTRVERQFASKLPLTLSTVRAFRDNAREFNPFDNISFVGGANLEVLLGDYSGKDWIFGCALWRLLQEDGWSYQQLYKMLNRGKNGKRSGNANKIVKDFAPFLRRGSVGDGGAIDISSGELYERYRESITRQLAA